MLELFTRLVSSPIRSFASDSDMAGSAWLALIEAGHRAFDQGRYSDAEHQFRSAVAEAEVSGVGTAQLASTLNDLGEVCRVQGELGQAELLFRRALAVLSAGPEDDAFAVSLTLNNLAAVFHDQGRDAQSTALYRQALGVAEPALGPDHPVIASILTNLAVNLRSQQEYSRAVPLLVRALRIWITTGGLEDPRLGPAFNNLASL
jgi:tetratricopeptide (TPR) repeat protein